MAFWELNPCTIHVLDQMTMYLWVFLTEKCRKQRISVGVSFLMFEMNFIFSKKSKNNNNILCFDWCPHSKVMKYLVGQKQMYIIIFSNNVNQPFLRSFYCRIFIVSVRRCPYLSNGEKFIASCKNQIYHHTETNTQLSLLSFTCCHFKYTVDF